MTEARERDIIESFVGLADRLVEDYDVIDLTTQLTEDCTRLLDVDAAGLLLADGVGVLHLLAATSEQTRALEAFQLQREEGPCLDCYRTGVPVTVTDLTADPSRWPRFSAVAGQQGFHSVHAIPMRVRGNQLGALGLFGTSPGALSGDDLTLARGLAHVASIAIVGDNQATARGSLVPGLQAAVASRAMLEMAKGMLAETQAVDMQTAFDRLRDYARLHEARLTDVARALLFSPGEERQRLLAELAGPRQ